MYQAPWLFSCWDNEGGIVGHRLRFSPPQRLKPRRHCCDRRPKRREVVDALHCLRDDAEKAITSPLRRPSRADYWEELGAVEIVESQTDHIRP